MDEVVRNAIETIDSARQHKCELEGRLRQLESCLSQVSITSERSRKAVQSYFADMQKKITNVIKLKSKGLIDKINEIEKEALEPLKECKVILNDGILEATSVIKSGENLLHQDDVHSENNIKKLNKFKNMTDSLSLDSVPEVPSLTEVACVSFHLDNSNITDDICSSLKSDGEISKQAPVQITELEPRPGAMVVSWDEIDGDVSVDWADKGNTVLYKLQYCQGKINLMNDSSNVEFFRDAYVGESLKHTVKKLLPNTVYTFRVGHCLVERGEKSSDPRWSPWSVYQDGITTMPGYEWTCFNESEAYSLQDRGRVALKKNNSSQILYSKLGGYVIGYPIAFRIENEGKSNSLGDGFALIAKLDQSSYSIVRDGTLCVAADGRIFINGTESKTKFANFCRNMCVRFVANEIQLDRDLTEMKSGKRSKGKSSVTLRVSITVMDKEVVFDWKIPSSAIVMNSSSKSCLNFAATFKSPNWKFSVI